MLSGLVIFEMFIVVSDNMGMEPGSSLKTGPARPGRSLENVL